MEAFYDLHSRTRQRQGVPVQPLHYFQILYRRIIQQGIGFVLAYQTGKPIAGAVFLHYNKTLIYKYGASNPDYWHLRPNDLLFWNVIERACEQGFHWLDWGKTDVENDGLRKFKSGWGSEEQPLFYSNFYLDKADHSTKGLRGGPVEKIMNGMIRKSPYWVSRAIGEVLYGHFG